MSTTETWLNEMISRVKIIEKECLAKGLGEKVMDLLIDRAVEPAGLWRGSEAKGRDIPPEEMKAALEAAKRKYDLDESKGSLILRHNLETSTFKDCAASLREFGYSYDKSIKGFRKQVK